MIDPTDEKISELQMQIKQQGNMLKHIEFLMTNPDQAKEEEKEEEKAEQDIFS